MQKIGDAMKAHDSVRVSTLRMLLSEFKNEKINKQHDLTDEEELIVLRREAKKRKEAIEMYSKANAEDKAETEKQELAILQEFLPAEVTEEEMMKLIDESISSLNANGMQDMGKVIGKDGKTAKSIRTLLRVLGAKNDARLNLKIIEPEGEKGPREEKKKSATDEVRELERDLEI